MLFTEENNHLFSIYNNLILENPDTIYYDGEYHSYNDDIGNYTGFMNKDGNYAMTKMLDGHGNFRNYIKSGDLKKLKIAHNFNSLEDVKNAFSVRGYEFRLWPKFQIFSIWDSNIEPEYKKAVDAIISAIPGGEGYLFDNNIFGNENDYLEYDQFIKDDLSDDEKESIKRTAIRKAQDERILADYKLGNKRRASADDDRPSFYRRDGD